MSVHSLKPVRMPINTCAHCDHNELTAGLILFGIDGTPKTCGNCNKPWFSVRDQMEQNEAP